jgi:hypothetical protein
MIKIVYLGSDYSEELEFENESQRDDLILEHPNREVYSVEGFVEAFNQDYISDLGYAVTVDDDRLLNDLRP